MKTETLLKRINPKSAVKCLISLAAGAALMPAAAFGEKGAFLPALACCLPAVLGSFSVAGGILFSMLFGFEPSVIAMLAGSAVGVLVRLWFADINKRRYPASAAIASGLCSLSIRLIFAVTVRLPLLEALPAMLGCIVSAMAVYSFSSTFKEPALSELKGQDISRVRILFMLLVCALCSYSYGGFGPGRAAAVFAAAWAVYFLPKSEAVLFSGYACAGLLLCGGSLDSFAPAIVLAAVICPEAARKMRGLTAGCVAAVSLIIHAVFSGEDMLACGLCLAAGAAAFVLLPEKALKALPNGGIAAFSEDTCPDCRGKYMANALERLSARLEYARPTERLSLGEMVCAGVCMGCERYSGCYSDDSEDSIESPSHICIHFDEVRERAREAERRLKAETENELEALRRVDSFKAMLSAAAVSLAQTPGSRTQLSQNGSLSAFSGELYISPDGVLSAYYKNGDRVSGQRLAKAVEAITGKRYNPAQLSESGSYSRLDIIPKGGLTAETGSFQRPGKHGENGDKSGDCLSVFNAGQYIYAAVSDGMGTGEEANVCSFTLLDALKELLAAGFEPKAAIPISAQYLKCSIVGESFATLDLLRINRLSGEMDFYKCGGCKSVVISGDELRIIPSGGYPVGIMDGAEIFGASFSANAGDTIILATDGAAAASGFMGATAAPEKDADSLAYRIGTAAVESGTPETADDITVLVIKLSES